MHHHYHIHHYGMHTKYRHFLHHKTMGMGCGGAMRKIYPDEMKMMSQHKKKPLEFKFSHEKSSKKKLMKPLVFKF
jgi:hypothetical protein